MITCGVDLAQKMSAYCILDDDGKVLDEYHTMFEEGHLGWWISSFLVPAAKLHGVQRLVVEDLPYGLGFMKITKDVSKLQGRIEQSCHDQDLLQPEYVQPQKWMTHYSINGKGSAARVLPCALKLGYEPPIEYRDKHRQERALYKKAQTDYAAAYLIARWAQEVNDG